MALSQEHVRMQYDCEGDCEALVHNKLMEGGISAARHTAFFTGAPDPAAIVVTS